MPSRDARARQSGIASRWKRAACLVAWAALIAAPVTADSQVFYKWTDKDGKVQYGDQPPKNFSGEVIRIEVDPTAHVTALPPPPRAAPDAAKSAAPPPPDVATKRRELRNKLEGDLARAREKLELAKAALADVSMPHDDERQVIQQRVDKGRPSGPGSASTGGMLGLGAMLGAAPRSNCQTVSGADGRQVVICPTMVPNEAYHERRKKLEEAVQRAEEEVAAAETAYRRGVD